MDLLDTLSPLLMPAIVTLAVLLVIGVFFGFLIVSQRRTKTRPSRVKGSSPEATRRGLVEQMRVYRDERTGILVIETHNQIVRRRSELTVNQSDWLSRLLNELRDWLGKPEIGGHPISPRFARGSINPFPEPELPAAEPDHPRSFLLNPLDTLTKAVSTDVPNDPSTPRSIAAQIDAILQEKLADSDMQGRVIRLLELPEKGVTVLVGVNQYASIEEVPELEVKELIQASVRQWERQTSG